jgi:Domain of unknown function (DUF1772)
MPVMLRLSSAVCIGPSHSRHRIVPSRPRRYAGIAAGLTATVVLLTVTMLVPINNRIAAWPAAGELSRGLANRWDRLHWVRVAILAVLFVVLAVAAT